MMSVTPLFLGRVQFTVCLSFFLLFMALALALSWLLLYFKLRAHYGKTSKAQDWMNAYRFWVRVFALTVVLTLAAAAPVLLQLGTIWSGLMSRVGNIAGPLLGLIALCGFVLKSCFLGVMLFGQQRISERLHTLSVLVVALGHLVIMFWIVALVSWMQTPSGAVAVDGRYQIYDWLQVVFNPSMGWTLGMSILSALLAAAFLMMGTLAWQALRRPLDEGERAGFRSALGLACATTLLLFPLGAGTGTMIAHHQPAKAAAVAAYWHEGDAPDMVLLGWPDTRLAATRAALVVPRAAAPWLGRSAHGHFLALENYANMQPPVALTFWLFRLVVLLALLMLLSAWWVFVKLRQQHLNPTFLPESWLRILVGMSGAGGVMVLAGWIFTFVGLEPYVVNHAITQTEVLGPALPLALWVGTFGFAALYIILLIIFVRMLSHAASHGVVPVHKKMGAHHR
jgi:cytochrome d ubiquinol oxidase subunit I